MVVYIPYYTGNKWAVETLESLECNLYKRHREGYTIFAYNNAIAYNGDNIKGAYAYINKWKNRK